MRKKEAREKRYPPKNMETRTKYIRTVVGKSGRATNFLLCVLIFSEDSEILRLVCADRHTAPIRTQACPPAFGMVFIAHSKTLTTGDHRLIGPMVYTKTYIFTYFYQQYLALFTMAPRNSGEKNATPLFRNKNAWIHFGGEASPPPLLRVNGVTKVSHALQYGVIPAHSN